MHLIDTHTHLYLPEFQGEGEGTADGGAAAVDRAVAAGVDMMIMPNIDCSTVAPLRQLCEARPANVRGALGLHPTEVGADWEEQVGLIAASFDEDGAPSGRWVAVGEVGIDLYWDATLAELQMQAFERQCEIAVERSLPVIVHCRSALPQVLEVVTGLRAKPALVMHSFGGSDADVERVRAVAGDDVWFGINGIVTFKNSRLADVLPAIGLDRLLLETDSPYLAPVPFRGRRNESSYMVHTAARVADALGLGLDAVAEATSASAARVFSLGS